MTAGTALPEDAPRHVISSQYRRQSIHETIASTQRKLWHSSLACLAQSRITTLENSGWVVTMISWLQRIKTSGAWPALFPFGSRPFSEELPAEDLLTEMTLKVANIITRFNSAAGGPPRTVGLIGQAALGRWHVELFTTDYQESSADKLLMSEFPGHVNVLRAAAQRPLGGLMMMLRGWTGYEVQLVRGAAPNLLHIHGVWTPYLTAFAWAAKRHGIPYIVAPHGMLEPWSLNVHKRRKLWALRTYQGQVLSGAAAIHATSEMEARNLRSLPWIRSPIHVIPNAVELPARFHQAPREDGGEKSLLFLSRVHQKKGLEILLRAWDQVRPNGWRLLIVGGGEESYVQQLKQFCAARGIPGVEFHGHVDGEAREEMFARASATVLPTYSENFGNIVAESLVRALPVITTTGTPWSVIRERKLGWYVDPETAQLRAALEDLVSTPAAELHEMGQRGRQYALSNLTTEAVRDRLLHMYEAALHTR